MQSDVGRLEEVRFASSRLSDFLELCPIFDSCLFRGQSDATWQLVPSLYREEHCLTNPSEYAFDGLETVIISDFVRGARQFGDDFESWGPISQRIVAQHYGLPTRLLDWTKNPLIALFFAIQACPGERDAAVYTVSNVGGPNLTKYSAIDQPGSGRFSYLGPFVRVKPPLLDRRIVTQSSRFTLCSFGGASDHFLPLDMRDLGDIDPETGANSGVSIFKKIVVSAKVQRALLFQLNSMGIDQSSLFPDLSGLAEATIKARRIRPMSVPMPSKKQEN